MRWEGVIDLYVKQTKNVSQAVDEFERNKIAFLWATLCEYVRIASDQTIKNCPCFSFPHPFWLQSISFYNASTTICLVSFVPSANKWAIIKQFILFSIKQFAYVRANRRTGNWSKIFDLFHIRHEVNNLAYVRRRSYVLFANSSKLDADNHFIRKLNIISLVWMIFISVFSIWRLLNI